MRGGCFLFGLAWGTSCFGRDAYEGVSRSPCGYEKDVGD